MRQNSVNIFGNPSPADHSFFSGAKSINSNGAGIASRINNALSRIVWNIGNTSMNEEDNADIVDLIGLIEELNQSTDLAAKLNNHSKILKILEPPEENKGNISAAAQVKLKDFRGAVDGEIKEMMKKCKEEL